MRRRLAAALALLVSLFAAPSLAQTSPPPRFQEVDGNGVDLISGRFVFGMTEGVIGSGEGAVSLERSQRNDYGRTDQWSGVLYQRTSGGATLMVVQFGGRSDTFTISGGTYTSTTGNGATLTATGTGYSYRASDGTTVSYDSAGPDLGYPWIGPGCNLGDPGTCALPMAVTRPDGTSFVLNWTIVERCHEYDEELNCIQPAAYFRFDGPASSTGYSFSFSYASDSPGPGTSAPPPDWYQRTSATFNNAVAAPSPLPTVTYASPSAGVEEVTDTGGRTWRITSSGSDITGLRRPGSTSDDIVVSYGAGGVVSAVTRDGVASSYSRVVSGAAATTTITNALSQQTVVVADLNLERITQVTDPLGRITSFQYDSSSRLIRVTIPEGNYLAYSYDARGNLTQTQHVPKGGSGSPTLTTSAAYPATCADPVTCNRPTSTTDARGNVTDYEWSATHGGLVSVTAPAPTAGATRPQTRYGYTLTNGEYRLTSMSACQAGTVATCVGTADEARTTAAYDANSNIVSVTRSNGSGTLSSAQAMTYDPVGNLLTVDGPLAGTADTIRYRYNGARQIVGVVGPDPDGAGSLKHRAVRTVYRSDGLATLTERGTVNGQTDADWAAFVSLEQVATDYDANDRPVVQRLESGGTAYALTQTGYDALGRPECAAQRMNPAAFASLPSSACTLGTEGSFGPDRIVRTTYDAAGQVTLVQTGYGVTGVQANEVATAYTSNGRIAHVTDGENNRTTYEYDGLDRLVKTRFPVTAAGANQSSTSDYEQLTLDAAGNATTRRLRDGTSIAFVYDALNRPVSKDLPGAEPDVTYAYDLLGRLTSASTSAQTLSFTFDALGRNLTQAGPLGTVASAWDAAGRRTRLTYPGSGLYVDYDYLVTGEVSAIRENGATSGAGVLGTYAYDDRGRRTGLTRGNGTVTSYSYDPVARLAELVQNLASTASDLTLGFTYNPASQIVANTRSNDAFSYTGMSNQNVTDTHNGLNQMTATGTSSVTHDARGNVTAIGSAGYTYTSENMLTGGPGGVGLAYDPLLRLYQTAAAATTRFAYDGVTMIAEYNGSNQLQRRYVQGPGIDEPLVWYEGTGTTDRRWLHADERRSVVAQSDSMGNVTAINRYDEYGAPQETLSGRFGYTGQAWLPEAGLFYYRARIYNPQLGRFMQTDPIGYGSGMNLYAYVGGDPVNLADPLGLCQIRVFGLVKTTIWPSGTRDRDVLSKWTERSGCAIDGRTSIRLIGDSGFGGNASSPVCEAVRREGDNITVEGTVAVGLGDFNPNSLNFTDQIFGPVDPLVAQSIVDMMNDGGPNGWTGQIGAYSVTMRLRLGYPGMFRVYIGNPGAGGRAELGGPRMWLTPAMIVGRGAGLLIRHEVGHWFFNAHPQQYAGPNIMNPGSGGNPRPEHIDTLLSNCGLSGE